MRRRRVIRQGKIARSVEWDYEPTARQKEFHQSPVRFKLFGGAFGGGKSFSLCAEIIDLSLEFPGNRIYLARHRLVDLENTTLESFWRVCPKGLIRKHWKAERVIELWNGSETLYGGLGSEVEIDRIKSAEFGAFAIDEASETREEYFNILASRLRWKLPDGSYPRFHGLITSNPEPGWVKQRFIDEKKNNHVFVRSLPTDNPYLPDDYVSTLRESYPEDWIKRYLEGSWDHFEGQVYKEFNKDRHVFRDMEIGRDWERVRVIDHGYTNPTCCLWVAADYDGRLIFYDEHYESGLTVQENANIIRQKHPKFNGITLIDPSCFSRTQMTGGVPCSIADEYQACGIPCISPYTKDGYVQEGVGITLVKQRLKEGSLLIHEQCANTISEMINLKWRSLKASSRSQNAPEVPVDENNHAMDCVRYVAVWKPRGSEPSPQPPPAGSIRWWIDKYKRGKSRGGYAGWG